MPTVAPIVPTGVLTVGTSCRRTAAENLRYLQVFVSHTRENSGRDPIYFLLNPPLYAGASTPRLGSRKIRELRCAHSLLSNPLASGLPAQVAGLIALCTSSSLPRSAPNELGVSRIT